LALVMPLGLAACGKKAPTPAPVAVTDDAERTRREAEERARLEAEAQARREAEARAAEAQREIARKRAVLEEMVFFDYDISSLRADARATLDAKVQVLRADPAITLRIGGHADERGSTEYNLALGARRAQSIMDYLAGFGIAASRMQTLSYGEERPLEGGHEERSWARNRRGDFVITGGLPGGN
jgi:peptidoglycan-associated lipoprotein